MSIRPAGVRAMSVICCSTAWVVVQAGPVQAVEASKVLRIRSVEARRLSSPKLRTSNPGAGSSEDWRRLTTEYQTAPEWMDDLAITYFVLLRPDPKKSGIRDGRSGFLLLRGQSRYVNLKKGRHISEMYIHPSTIERFGGIERIGVVFKTKGRLLSTESEPESQAGWWEKLSPIDGLILSRDATPFGAVSPDHYEATLSRTPGAR